MSNELSLASLMLPSKTVEMEFPGYDGFTVSLCFLAREELIKLRKKCTSTKFNRNSHKPEDTLDEEKFVKEYCKSVIKGWTGFKVKYLEELLLVNTEGLDPETELPSTEDNILNLMRNCEAFESWVQQGVTSLENFTKSK